MFVFYGKSQSRLWHCTGLWQSSAGDKDRIITSARDEQQPLRDSNKTKANLFSNRKFRIKGEGKETRAKSLCRESRAEQGLQKPLCCLVGPCHPLSFSRLPHSSLILHWELCPSGLSQHPSNGSLNVQLSLSAFHPHLGRFYDPVPFLLSQVWTLVSVLEELMYGIFCEAHREVGVQMVET